MLEKIVTYKGQEYKIQIKWSGSAYCLWVVGFGGYVAIPEAFLSDIDYIKRLIVDRIENFNKSDLEAIKKWDGNI